MQQTTKKKGAKKGNGGGKAKGIKNKAVSSRFRKDEEALRRAVLQSKALASKERNKASREARLAKRRRIVAPAPSEDGENMEM